MRSTKHSLLDDRSVDGSRRTEERTDLLDELFSAGQQFQVGAVFVDAVHLDYLDVVVVHADVSQRSLYPNDFVGNDRRNRPRRRVVLIDHPPLVIGCGRPVEKPVEEEHTGSHGCGS